MWKIQYGKLNRILDKIIIITGTLSGIGCR